MALKICDVPSKGTESVLKASLAPELHRTTGTGRPTLAGGAGVGRGGSRLGAAAWAEPGSARPSSAVYHSGSVFLSTGRTLQQYHVDEFHVQVEQWPVAKMSAPLVLIFLLKSDFLN